MTQRAFYPLAAGLYVNRNGTVLNIGNVLVEYV